MSLEINTYGDLIWRNEKGQFHREKGPAIIKPKGGVVYHFNNQPHRLDGPAVIYPNSSKYYWIHGEHYNKEEYSAERLKCYELKY